jgi:hypothetical protein
MQRDGLRLGLRLDADEAEDIDCEELEEIKHRRSFNWRE